MHPIGRLCATPYSWDTPSKILLRWGSAPLVDCMQPFTLSTLGQDANLTDFFTQDDAGTLSFTSEGHRRFQRLFERHGVDLRHFRSFEELERCLVQIGEKDFQESVTALKGALRDPTFSFDQKRFIQRMLALLPAYGPATPVAVPERAAAPVISLAAWKAQHSRR